MVVWAFSLTVRAVAPDSGHGQQFSLLQLGGFVVLVAGTLYYNEILRYPFAQKQGKDPLLLAQEQGWTVEEAARQPEMYPVAAGTEPIIAAPRQGGLQADARTAAR